MISREEALERIGYSLRCLEHMAARIRDPTYQGEGLVDDITLAALVHVSITQRPAMRRMMDLVDAIGLYAEIGGPIENVRGAQYGFEPEAFRAAVKAWRARPTRGRGSGRTAPLWPLVAEAVRSAGIQPPAPETIRKEHERWRKARGRPSTWR